MGVEMSGVNFDPMVQWSSDEVFEYFDIDNYSYTVSWNMYGDKVSITSVEDEFGNTQTGDEFYETDGQKLTEDMLSYIDEEFLHSEDFWLTKMGYDF